MIESFRISVMEDTAIIKSKTLKSKTQKLAMKLAKVIKDEKLLFTEYISTVGHERELQSIDDEINKLKQYCNQRGLDFKRLLCQRITQADLNKARQLIKTHQS